MPCPLCAAPDTRAYTVLPTRTPADIVMLCAACIHDATHADPLDAARLGLLRDAIWSEDAGVQVLAWRCLRRLSEHAWATDLLEQVWLDEAVSAWAEAGLPAPTETDAPTVPTLDSNGTPLAEGDAVTLIKDLDVKGAGFTAKRGTLVKNIHLTDDPGLVEGRVSGMVIVLKTDFLKRA